MLTLTLAARSACRRRSSPRRHRGRHQHRPDPGHDTRFRDQRGRSGHPCRSSWPGASSTGRTQTPTGAVSRRWPGAVEAAAGGGAPSSLSAADVGQRDGRAPARG
ncbi:hypothetical protein HBB16_21725 [Pseudonocardia sp. MCCB 268]|nr:hypothetical protein [Pseudonocardia cytotoxica]